MTLQERINEVPDHSGGTIHLEKSEWLDKPLVIAHKADLTIRGDGSQNIVGNFGTPGSVIHMTGCTNCRLIDFDVQTANENAECGVLLTRAVHNGNGSGALLSNVKIQGKWQFASLCSVGCESTELYRCHLATRRPNTYGWLTGSELPSYLPPDAIRGRKANLRVTAPAAGGTNTILRMVGGSIVSKEDGVTSIHIGDGTLNVVLDQAFISNSAGFHSDGVARGLACVELGDCDGVTIRAMHTESHDCQYGLVTQGTAKNVTVTEGSRINGRIGVHVPHGTRLLNSEIRGTCQIMSWGSGQRYPLLIEGDTRGSRFDIGTYSG